MKRPSPIDAYDPGLVAAEETHRENLFRASDAVECRRVIASMGVKNGHLAPGVGSKGRPNASKCFACGSDYFIHGHHLDYSKPCETLSLCCRCHVNVHWLIREGGGETTITPGGLMRKTVYFAREEWQAIRQKAFGDDKTAAKVVREAVRVHLGL